MFEGGEGEREGEHMGDGGKGEVGVNDGQERKGDSKQARQDESDVELEGKQKERKEVDRKNKSKTDRKL